VEVSVPNSFPGRYFPEGFVLNKKYEKTSLLLLLTLKLICNTGTGIDIVYM
jgi:hypothetical protein